MVMESGFSSPRRSDALPAGLRVLVVDDDMAWLKILEKMLKKCSYEVTTCALAQEALHLLRDRKGGFDIVISDVNMPDMDGFKLLEHVGLEMDLPVIMMSVDGETSRVMKGVQHGACDYLLKPIRMKELRNIWQHVVRKRMQEVREIECFDDRNGSNPSNNGHYGADQALLRKRKDVENKHDEKESTDSSSMKKARVVWTVELHQKFVKAVNQIGIDSDKVGPKKILDMMNVPWLTRENVASHLQKYRLYLSRIRKEDKMEFSCGVMKNSDHPPKDNSGTFSGTNSTSKQQNDFSSNQVYPENQLPAGAMVTIPFDTDMKSSNLSPLTEERKSFNSDNSDPRKTCTSKVGLDSAFGPPETSVNYASFDSPISCCYPWTVEISSMQYEPEFRPHFSLEDCFSQPALPVVQQHIQDEPLESASLVNHGPAISRSDNIGLIDSKHINVKPEGDDIKQLFPIERELESFLVSNPEAFSCVSDMSLDIKNRNSTHITVSAINEQTLLESSIQSFPLHSKSPFLNQRGLEPKIDITLHTKTQSSSHGSLIGLNSEQGSQCLGNESDFELLGEDFMFCWLQGGEIISKDIEFDYIGLSDFNFPGHVSEAPLSKFGLDYDVFDCKECPVDQGILFS